MKKSETFFSVWLLFDYRNQKEINNYLLSANLKYTSLVNKNKKIEINHNKFISNTYNLYEKLREI